MLPTIIWLPTVLFQAGVMFLSFASVLRVVGHTKTMDAAPLLDPAVGFSFVRVFAQYDTIHDTSTTTVLLYYEYCTTVPLYFHFCFLSIPVPLTVVL